MFKSKKMMLAMLAGAVMGGVMVQGEPKEMQEGLSYFYKHSGKLVHEEPVYEMPVPARKIGNKLTVSMPKIKNDVTVEVAVSSGVGRNSVGNISLSSTQTTGSIAIPAQTSSEVLLRHGGCDTAPAMAYSAMACWAPSYGAKILPSKVVEITVSSGNKKYTYNISYTDLATDENVQIALSKQGSVPKVQYQGKALNWSMMSQGGE